VLDDIVETLFVEKCGEQSDSHDQVFSLLEWIVLKRAQYSMKGFRIRDSGFTNEVVSNGVTHLWVTRHEILSFNTS
jgi:hypothetical protein